MSAKGLTGRALGEAVLDVVLSHPEKHDQTHTACGTTACIAGWTVALHYGLDAVSFDEDGYFKLKVAQNLGDSMDEAVGLLGVDLETFSSEVFTEMDRDTAISNFKHLLDTSGL